MRLTTAAIDRRIESIASTLSSIGAIVAMTAVVFYIDRATGSAPFHHLYYLPIILAARRFEVGGAASTAASSIVLYHLANPDLLATWYREADLVQSALFRLGRQSRATQAEATIQKINCGAKNRKPVGFRAITPA